MVALRGEQTNTIIMQKGVNSNSTNNATVSDKPSKQHQHIIVEPSLKDVPAVEEPQHHCRRAKPILITTTRKHAATTTTDLLEGHEQRQNKRKRRISFDNDIRIRPIPMRSDYHTTIQSNLWSDSLQIQREATRNAMEFASEGWDWRRVRLDHEMYLCTVTGERIHPVHFQNAGLGDELLPTNLVAPGTAAAAKKGGIGGGEENNSQSTVYTENEITP